MSVSNALTSGLKDKALILLYHRVDQPIRDRWELSVSPSNFQSHLECLRRLFTPVRLLELAERHRAGRLEQGMVAITFDDGYQDNFTIAFPILKRMNVPATFFISGDGAVMGESFWWDVLDASNLAMDLDNAQATELHRRMMVASSDERLRVFGGLARPQASLPVRMAVEQLKELSDEPLADIGAHGWSHRVLGGLDRDEAQREVSENIQVMAQTIGKEIHVFAYPFGGPFDSKTMELLREAGIQAACAVRPEPVTASSDALALPRLEVGDWTAEEFEVRLRSLLDD